MNIIIDWNAHIDYNSSLPSKRRDACWSVEACLVECCLVGLLECCLQRRFLDVCLSATLLVVSPKNVCGTAFLKRTMDRYARKFQFLSGLDLPLKFLSSIIISSEDLLCFWLKEATLRRLSSGLPLG